MKNILNDDSDRGKYDLIKNEATPNIINHEVTDQFFCETYPNSYIYTRDEIDDLKNLHKLVTKLNKLDDNTQ